MTKPKLNWTPRQSRDDERTYYHGSRGGFVFFKVYVEEGAATRWAFGSYLVGASERRQFKTADEAKASAEAEFAEWLRRASLRAKS